MNVTFSYESAYDGEKFVVPYIKINAEDSVIFEDSSPLYRSVKDTLKFKNLQEGEYTIHYYNILGEEIIKKAILKDNCVKDIRIAPDSISIDEYYKDTPIEKLKEDKSYIVKSYFGGVAGMEGFYKVSKIENNIFYESSNQSRRRLSQDEIAALKRFEAYLLGIAHFGLGNGCLTDSYTIIKDNDSIKINLCRWQESQKFYPKIYKPEYDTRNDNFNSK
ncbi:hypothetical protein [Flavobacterium suaedae]|uniref:hypothetical protein n=1 Tax=Flavobacterium suaedae TaxID=1767027 RepID=UPI001665BEBF|nr:hypothetical protein [Flavobacterium suaedae]